MSQIAINTVNSTLKLPKLNSNLKFYIRQVIALLCENCIIRTALSPISEAPLYQDMPDVKKCQAYI